MEQYTPAEFDDSGRMIATSLNPRKLNYRELAKVINGLLKHPHHNATFYYDSHEYFDISDALSTARYSSVLKKDEFINDMIPRARQANEILIWDATPEEIHITNPDRDDLKRVVKKAKETPHRTLIYEEIVNEETVISSMIIPSIEHLNGRSIEEIIQDLTEGIDEKNRINKLIIY